MVILKYNYHFYYYYLIILIRGTNGFGKIGITDGDGICGINMKVVYPTSVD